MKNAIAQTTSRGTRRIDIGVLTKTAMLSAIAFVLMYLEIAIPIMPSFIKLDLSDLPALIASCCFGPLSGICVCFIKNAIHLFFSSSGGVGELSNFILGSLFVIPAGLVCRNNKTRKNVILGSLLGAFLMAALSLVTNYFIVYPVYYNFMPKEEIINMYQAILPSVDTIFDCLLVFNVPFTFVKGMISAILMLPFYRVLLTVLDGKNQSN